MGTNLSGDEKACLVNKRCDASYGELHFTDNGGHSHILIRGKDKYDSKKNFLSLDGKMITQTELVGFYKDKKLFLSILNPLFFLSKKPAEQKELVDKYLSDITPDNLMEVVYNNLNEDEQKILEGIPKDIPTYVSELNSNIKKSESTISALNGKIDYAQNIANEKLPIYKTFEKDVELSLARQELSFLNTNKNIVDKEKQKQVVDNLEKDILNKETEIEELEKSMKEGKILYLQIKNGASCECPTCKQHIQDASKQNTIEHMKENLIADFNRKNLLETQKKDLQAKLMVERCKYHALEGETTIEKAKQIAVVQENIAKLENEKLNIQKFNNEIQIKETAINNAKADISKFNKEIMSYQKLIDSSKKAKQVAQKLYISYIEEKMKLAKQYLKNVDIRFYSVLKTTGELKEDFVITYNGSPLSDLSRSETIATALEFANMFNHISRVNLPIFIDDYESCADYNFIKDYSNNSQLIVSTVQKHTPLTIANYNNKSENTIIKPIIKGYRKMTVYKSNKNAIRKAA